MTPQEPHPQRVIDYFEECPARKKGMQQCSRPKLTCRECIDGCASHTPAQQAQQRIDAVIKEFIPWLEQKRKYYGCCSGVDANDNPEDCDPYDTVLKKIQVLLREGERG